MTEPPELAAVRRWYTERMAAWHTSGDAAAAQVRASAVAVMSSGGTLTSVQRSILARATAELERRPRDAFPQTADLLRLARLVALAAGPPDGPLSRAGTRSAT